MSSVKPKAATNQNLQNEEGCMLVLFNDEVNTFDYVIECLIRVCDHESERAEQCAYIAHFTGKCSVNTGEYIELKAQCGALNDLGLTVEILT